METINVASCTVFKTGTNRKGEPFTLYSIKCSDGREGSSFSPLPIGQCQAEITQNGKWLNFKPAQEKPAKPAPAAPPVKEGPEGGKATVALLTAISNLTNAVNELNQTIKSKQPF